MVLSIYRYIVDTDMIDVSIQRQLIFLYGYIAYSEEIVGNNFIEQ